MNTEKNLSGGIASCEIVKKELFEQENSIRITFNTEEGTLQLSKAALAVLGNPAYVMFLINPKTRHMLIMGTNSKMKDGIFLRNSIHPYGFVPCDELLKCLSNLMGWESGWHYLIPGSLLPVNLVYGEPTLAFDLQEYCVSRITNRKGADTIERKEIHPEEHAGNDRLGIRPEELLQGEYHAVV